MFPIRFSLRRFTRRIVCLAQLACVVLVFPVIALAQAAGQEEEGPKRYVNQYAITVMLIALGVIVLCKPSGREDKVKERYVGD